ncbi:hypothetical protein KFE98_18055 [bacterium SCSIO 12741]|nr:hypothetical protein KFE98_18055 [bacterium SCSIO 12741]
MKNQESNLVNTRNTGLLPAYLVLLITTIVLSGPVQAQSWTNVSSIQNIYHNKISFTDDQLGFSLVGTTFTQSTDIYRTLNGGQSWQKITPQLPLQNYTFLAIQFLDTNNGFLVVRGRGVQTQQFSGYLYQTVNGGKNWTSIGPKGMRLSLGEGSLHFFDTQRGVVASGGGHYYTDNGGAQWSSIDDQSYWSVNEIDFSDHLNGIAGAWDGTFAYRGILFTTTNGGVSWDTLELGMNSAIERVNYTSQGTAYALGPSSWQRPQILYKTENWGSSWDSLSLDFLVDSNDAATDIHFTSHERGYLSTRDGHIFRSEDGGKSWSREFFGNQTTQGLDRLESNGQTLFAFGPMNVLLKRDFELGSWELMDRDEESPKVFPNPCSHNNLVNLSSSVIGTYYWMDASGGVQAIGNREEEMPISVPTGLSSGQYWIVFPKSSQRPMKVTLR